VVSELTMKLLSSVIAATVVVTSTVSAHHSPASFNLDAQITIQGTVSRFDWANPHVYIYVRANTAAGDTREWTIETDGTSLLTRSGWSRDSIAVGDAITVRANPDRNAQRNHALLISMARADGVVLRPRSGGVVMVSRATSVAGVWDALRGFTQRRFGAFRPTATGAAAMKAYTEAVNPVANCVPFQSPFLQSLPYLNQIEVRGDTVVIRTEFFNVDRTVYMDGRGHPKDGVRTNQGHSIGRWEGGVLVVDTTLFADHLLGNFQGPQSLLPSGPRKHLVERYQLSQDGTRLLLNFVLEDPDYLAEPFTSSTEWDHAPALRLLRFGCEPEQARRFQFR
jgi:hypothetical protein